MFSFSWLLRPEIVTAAEPVGYAWCFGASDACAPDFVPLFGPVGSWTERYSALASTRSGKKYSRMLSAVSYFRLAVTSRRVCLTVHVLMCVCLAPA